MFTVDGKLTTPDGQERFTIEDGILSLFVEEADSSSNVVTRTVQTFYEDTPFPNYSGYELTGEFFEARDSRRVRKYAGRTDPHEREGT